jgi:hypothetical protein
MPSGKNFIASVGVMAAIVAIIAYVDRQGLSLDDVTLVEACRNANLGEVECNMFEEKGMTWDFKQPCEPQFKPDQYFFTPRQIFEQFQSGNSSYTEALENVFNQQCNPVDTDADYEAFRSGALISGRSEKRDLIIPLLIAAVAIAAMWALRIGPTYWLVNGLTNYKACSISLGLFGRITGDLAQCAEKGLYLTGNGGKNYVALWDSGKCKRYHTNGPKGWWYGHARSKKWYLNNGCVDHDNCLQLNKWKDGCKMVNGAKSKRDDCDGKLAKAAIQCLKHHKGWGSDCKDPKYQSTLVAGIMKKCPNCGKAFDGQSGFSCRRRANVRVLVDGVWTQKSL